MQRSLQFGGQNCFKFPATLAILHQDDLKIINDEIIVFFKSPLCIKSYSSNRAGVNNPILQIVLLQKS